ncbi:hypothetical protein PIROE2DRAFT_66946 [Piromyces sp. E2]|nr:hypothetical protein PIROE2DRAFT_66946 [Piromyces sp. E2]|eukprot:OUM68277.1 hypothetical protein PIROE2DRAFT_66946 [Piromyces sp. E2]
MSKEEFIVWALKFGKIIKDEDLWHEFISRIQKKRLISEESTDNIEMNDNKENADDNNKNIEELILSIKDISQEIESFVTELFLKNNNDNDNNESHVNSLPPLLLFHEMEWNYMIKLIKFWLKESEYKLILIKEKSTLSISQNQNTFKFCSIHRINNNHYLYKLLNHLSI